MRQTHGLLHLVKPLPVERGGAHLASGRGRYALPTFTPLILHCASRRTTMGKPVLLEIRVRAAVFVKEGSSSREA